jgi:hypothetical protein
MPSAKRQRLRYRTLKHCLPELGMSLADVLGSRLTDVHEMLLPRTRYNGVRPDSGNRIRAIRLREENHQADVQVETYIGGNLHS